MGYVHMVSRRFEPAVAALSEAVGRNPSVAFAHMILGSALAYGSKPIEGLEQLALETTLRIDSGPLFHELTRNAIEYLRLFSVELALKRDRQAS